MLEPVTCSQPSSKGIWKNNLFGFLNGELGELFTHSQCGELLKCDENVKTCFEATKKSKCHYGVKLVTNLDMHQSHLGELCNNKDSQATPSGETDSVGACGSGFCQVWDF